MIYNQGRKYKKCQSVGDDHKVVEEIGKFPDKVVGSDRAKEDKAECKNGKYDNSSFFCVAEQPLNIDFSKHVPA